MNLKHSRSRNKTARRNAFSSRTARGRTMPESGKSEPPEKIIWSLNTSKAQLEPIMEECIALPRTSKLGDSFYHPAHLRQNGNKEFLL
ncbi:hypothetical protein CEXT_644261 [Caerostris extrusa]|uniref:Uncharacterized protein n=1 Tax=Caerostris extrusa TaxID=172846 RepID=A0AAV4RWX0_CAEEX|nr:hypothetical protein CEXT_644261 [Caerostris extrusa]